MALKWMGGGKADHPMADARQAQRIVAELPASDAGKALQEITEWLESLNATEGFKLDRRFENIDLLDGAAKNHQRKLSQDYLSTSRQQKSNDELDFSQEQNQNVESWIVENVSEVGVVLRDGIFNGRDSLDMIVRDKSYLLMPSKMVEDGEDFDWAKFKVRQRQ